jgi:hypothetical protein
LEVKRKVEGCGKEERGEGRSCHDGDAMASVDRGVGIAALSPSLFPIISSDSPLPVSLDSCWVPIHRSGVQQGERRKVRKARHDDYDYDVVRKESKT